MFKKIILVFILALLPLAPVYSAGNSYTSASEDYIAEGDGEAPEFQYPASQTPPAVHISPSKNYVQIYDNLQPADFSYMHNIDPDQYYDIKDTTWAPYPLLRLNSYIYFKNQAIEPGYYLITPREHKGNWYMLFKQNGLVSYIIPVYSREIVPEGFYDTHLSKPKLTPSQKVHMGVLSFLGKFDSSKRREPVKSYMELTI